MPRNITFQLLPAELTRKFPSQGNCLSPKQVRLPVAFGEQHLEVQAGRKVMEVSFWLCSTSHHQMPWLCAIPIQDNFYLVFKGMREILWCLLPVRYSKIGFFACKKWYKRNKRNTIKEKADWCGLGIRYWNSHCSWFKSQFLSKAGSPTVFECTVSKWNKLGT